jgi:hypothetical protein
VALAGAVQSAEVQQLAVEMHPAPHDLNPLLQVKPQVVPSQVAVPPAGATQGVHETPQLATLWSSAQTPEHRCVPAPQAMSFGGIIEPSAIEASTIAPSAIAPSAIAPSAIAPSAFAASAFEASAIAESAFAASAIAPSAFEASAIAPSAVEASVIASSAASGVPDGETVSSQPATASAQVNASVEATLHE